VLEPVHSLIYCERRFVFLTKSTELCYGVDEGASSWPTLETLTFQWLTPSLKISQ